jgi:hypothetical protein
MVFIERELNVFHQVEIDVSVVGVFHPDMNEKLKEAVKMQ